ncbi:c-type cytochrome [Sungkyunkwania multivorans]|uniref:C-type cytochrome n=1 Tax=Sungkyunkwania multivorans TaxID=1173618 RepID=A0ABW3D232_9FLAO
MRLFFSFFSFFFVLSICSLLYFLNLPAEDILTTNQTIDIALATPKSAEYLSGKKLFNMNCAACHHPTKELLGPALNGVSEKYEKDWLYSWIKNNTALVTSGDALAIKISQYSPTTMNAFPLLSDAEIDDILVYIEE